MIGPRDEPKRHLIWETALDRLELDVLRAERMVANPAHYDLEPWDEPLVDGPLPADLVERALDLRDRQQQVQTKLSEALQTLGRQSAFTERVDRATGRVGHAVYVDVSA
jgi:hypothetical protein